MPKKSKKKTTQAEQQKLDILVSSFCQAFCGRYGKRCIARRCRMYKLKAKDANRFLFRDIMAMPKSEKPEGWKNVRRTVSGVRYLDRNKEEE